MESNLIDSSWARDNCGTVAKGKGVIPPSRNAKLLPVNEK